MAGKKVPGRRSGLRFSEKELPVWRFGTKIHLPVTEAKRQVKDEAPNLRLRYDNEVFGQSYCTSHGAVTEVCGAVVE
jgi:hypothetical protein